MIQKKQLPDSPTVDELFNAGVKVRPGFDPVTRNYDLLERYLQVPNHAMFLYTSEDIVLDKYIREHWAALDGLSGENCDIYVSLIQLLGGADAYSQFEEIKSLPGLDTIEPEDLPALHIWSLNTSIRILLNDFDDEKSLKNVFRTIFTKIKKANSPLTREQAIELQDEILGLRKGVFKSKNGQNIEDVYAGRDIIQINYNFNGGEETMNKDERASGTKQTANNVQVTGTINQFSDTENSQQEVRDATASGLEQKVQSERQGLILGKYSATGKWAVIGLVIVVIVFLVFRWLAG